MSLALRLNARMSHIKTKRKTYGAVIHTFKQGAKCMNYCVAIAGVKNTIMRHPPEDADFAVTNLQQSSYLSKDSTDASYACSWLCYDSWWGKGNVDCSDNPQCRHTMKQDLSDSDNDFVGVDDPSYRQRIVDVSHAEDLHATSAPM
ncbi:hypothetical protein GJ496_009584 [Pomphorhynchus laevis]|nr:hypothetical protein GJ496_009584 [Pomphorhynchus laevis]